ncbi:bacteriocin-like protein [Chryseobacterium gossypii]|uniref:bacteriocin-like protein n=1 Tax=Chryseobacterium gossypii TaxID=3231602 RepID=UPI003524792A
MKNLKKLSRSKLRDLNGGVAEEGSCTRCVTCSNGMRSCATDTIGNCDCAENLAQAMCKKWDKDKIYPYPF